MKRNSVWLIIAAFCLITPFAGTRVAAQSDTMYFSETGKSISGRFLEYWRTHGGIVQQGYPISSMLSERSETDGKIYTVQYFERSVFEVHPENPAPNDVLLSLLGSELYGAKYPNGAANQVPNTNADATIFPQTGKHVGGVFLKYWNTNGALAQQGYPISDEFVEVSPIDGKSYKVQYFERAVFEYHPENVNTAYEVLLSQLGRIRFDAKYSQRSSPTATPVSVPTQPVSEPTSSPTQGAALDCSGLPNDQGARVTPRCGYLGMTITISASGFRPGEDIQYFTTRPDNSTGAPNAGTADSNGDFTDQVVIVSRIGVWAVTLSGLGSGKQVVGYFKIAGPDTTQCVDGPPPASVSANVSPSCGDLKTEFNFAAWGFVPGEEVGYYWTFPNGSVAGLQGERIYADSSGYVTGPWFVAGINNAAGIYGLTLEGVQSHRKAFGYIKVYNP